MTKTSVAALAGQGLVAAAKDNYPRDGTTHSYVASFAEVEVDVETGKYHIVDFLAYADVGTVIHPAALGGQVLGPLDPRHRPCHRPEMGVRSSLRHAWFPSASTTHKPPTILDVPVDMQWEALDIPDPETPVGARGVGEPPVGGGCASILNALSDALGDEVFQRAPVNADTILTSLEAGRPMQLPLTSIFDRDIRGRAMAVIRDVMPAFDLLQPTSSPTHRSFLQQHGADAWVMAGGLDSFDWLKDRIKRPKVWWISVESRNSQGVRPTSDGIEIGAMTTLTEVVNHPLIKRITACSRKALNWRRRRRSVTRALSEAT